MLSVVSRACKRPHVPRHSGLRKLHQVYLTCTLTLSGSEDEGEFAWPDGDPDGLGRLDAFDVEPQPLEAADRPPVDHDAYGLPVVPLGEDGLPAVPGRDADGLRVVPDAEGLPVVPSRDGLPVPDADGLPVVPGADGLSVFPGADGLPVSDADGLQVVPSADGLPDVPGADGLSVVPGADGPPVMDADGLQVVPTADGLPAVPGADGLPVARSADRLAIVPGEDGVPICIRADEDTLVVVDESSPVPTVIHDDPNVNMSAVQADCSRGGALPADGSGGGLDALQTGGSGISRGAVPIQDPGDGRNVCQTTSRPEDTQTQYDSYRDCPPLLHTPNSTACDKDKEVEEVKGIGLQSSSRCLLCCVALVADASALVLCFAVCLVIR